MAKYVIMFFAVAVYTSAVADSDRIDQKKCMKKCLGAMDDKVKCEKICAQKLTADRAI